MAYQVAQNTVNCNVSDTGLNNGKLGDKDQIITLFKNKTKHLNTSKRTRSAGARNVNNE